MASLMNKKYSADIKGLISVDENKVITVSVEDVGDIDFATFIADFVDKDNVKVTLSYGEEVLS